MVNRATGMDGIEGTLTLEAEALVFTPVDTGRTPVRFPLGDVRRAHRVIGSPVLEITLAPGSPVRITGFYFVKPPRISGRDPISGRSFDGRRARRASAVALRTWSRPKKGEIQAWAADIRAARGSLREREASPGEGA